jgi:drug/metabolite transporter (DMT)-like permease
MKTKTWTALIAIYLAWGSTFLAIHFAVQSIPPFFMTGMRFLIAGLILFIWRRLAGDPAPSSAQWKSAGVIGTLLLVGGIGGVSWAEQYVNSGIAALIVAATPLWVVLLEMLQHGGKRPTMVTLAGMGGGLAGIIILIDPYHSMDRQQGYSILGIVVLLLAALSWSIGSLYSHEADLPKSALLGSGMELLVGSAGSFVLGLALGEKSQLKISAISASSVAGLAYLIIVGSLVGFVCYTWLLQVAPTELVVTYAYVNPLVAVLLGSLLAQEVLTPKVLMATPLILLAVIFIQAKRKDKKQGVAARFVTISEMGGED